MVQPWCNRVKILKSGLENLGFKTTFLEGSYAPGSFEVNRKRLYILYISEMDSGATLYVSTKVCGSRNYAALSISDTGHLFCGQDFKRLMHDE